MSKNSNKEFKTTTLGGQMVVSKTESGVNMVQMLPDNPCSGQVEPFVGRGNAKLHDDGSFDFVRNKRNWHATMLRLKHSSVSFGLDAKCRFIATGSIEQLEDFIEWLETESQQAVDFLRMLIETQKRQKEVKA